MKTLLLTLALLSITACTAIPTEPSYQIDSKPATITECVLAPVKVDTVGFDIALKPTHEVDMNTGIVTPLQRPVTRSVKCRT